MKEHVNVAGGILDHYKFMTLAYIMEEALKDTTGPCPAIVPGFEIKISLFDETRIIFTAIDKDGRKHQFTVHLKIDGTWSMDEDVEGDE